MSRARAAALALVNWKGVFYERYELDRRVTALEGANGAGKTTVMIAAYIVLLPDMTRLRFTNLGETAATGGDRGIWGRLGEPTRPSYAALELALGDGVRVVAGVLFTRKAEPSVELTPFLISELTAGVRLQDLLLVRTAEEEAIPELAELRENVARAGAKLEVFASAKDYFAALFELGVGALRLASDEDRGRLGDMLRTSMTGGISRAITSELRSFLLREQVSVGDTLARMRENLNACRRTRLEVAEAQLLEQEISGVYDAGQGMFAAALQATREQAREQRDAALRLEEAVQRGRQSLSDAERAAEVLESREQELVAELQAERAALEALREKRRAVDTYESLRAVQRDVDAELVVASADLDRARARQQSAVQAREGEKQKRELARQALDGSARGLADLQAGLDELYRRSAAHRNAQRLLAEVVSLTGEQNPLAGATLAARVEQVQSRLAALDAACLEHERTLTLASRRAEEWHSAFAALGELGQEASAGSAYERARAALAELAAEEQRLAERAAHERALTQSQRLAERQQAARKAARAAGLEFSGGGSLHRIEACLASADADLERLEEQKRALEDERRRVSGERALSRERMQRSQAELGRHRRALQRLERVNAVAGPCAPTREALQRVRDGLAQEKQEQQLALDAAGARREERLSQANQLEASGGQFAPELLRLRDELDGELLGNRFEELDVNEAARLEALLGPLTHAIVVDDVQEASKRLGDKPRELAELRLIAAGTELDFLRQKSQENSRDVYVDEGPALRVTQRPERPSLGRKAREARVLELRKDAVSLGEEVERARARLRSLTTALGELDQLLPDVELLERGDPAEAQLRLQVEEQQLAREEAQLEESVAELAVRANATRGEVSRYRGLLSEAFLLDAEDHAEKAGALASELARLEQVELTLARLEKPRKRLAALLDALRSPPLGASELERLERERAEHTAERDRSYRLLDALNQLVREEPALGWADAERALANREHLAPELEAQHQRARQALELAEQAVLAAEAAWERETAELQRAEAARQAIAAHSERLAQELTAAGSDAELTPGRLAERLAESGARVEKLGQEEREQIARRGAHAERVRRLGAELAGLERELGVAREAAEPAAARWQALRAQAERAQLLRSGESSERAELRSSVALLAEAQSRAELLRDRLAGARGGDTLAREFAGEARDDATRCLSLWLGVREWLARRVPAQIAQVDDPLLALERLRDHLSVLEQRLGHQEADLRGASEDIARGIDVQLRRAKAQVRRLNQNLNGVSFGSIAGIRVELRRAQQMEPVLRALAEGSAQELLFQSNLPTEEALSELMRRYGGGRGGGARVLDYREYLELVVEVQRKADGNWEPANPTRLSTGEAIGVGAALMMVVLAEWERDANLLRARRGPGSLRFLFLDEANRLSQDNLGSLFDLCESLDLQLLIAAPEVARADGNTTYRLVRKVSEDGREEVIVSGRRALGAEPAATSAPPLGPVQSSLFEH